MNRFTRYAVLVVMIALTITMSGCVRGYNKDLIQTIEPSQTAFLIPLDGNTNDQVMFDSEESLELMKVPTKRVTITHKWHKTGYFRGSGSWIQNHKLIIVERKPETREWTADTDSGTAAINQGITAESKQSITFSVSINVSAQIDEPNAAKFLYRYNNKALELIMDDELRARIEGRFVEEAASRTMIEILTQKAEIMEAVRADVVPYFAERGITIENISLKGDIQYADPAIQTAINKEFIRTREQEAQAITNATDAARALTDKIIAETIAAQEASMALIEAQKLVDMASKTAEEQAIRNQTNIDMAVAEATVIETIANANREELRQAVLAFSSETDAAGNYIVTDEAVEAYVQLTYYNAWDGSVPQTILSSVLSTLAWQDPNADTADGHCSR